MRQPPTRARALKRRAPALVVLAAALALLGVYLGSSGPPQLAVHVVRNRLVDGGGAPLRLLGVNRSGPEYACVQDQGIFAGPTDRRAILAMTAWRIDAVRIPLNEDCWLGINGTPARYSGPRYRRAIEAYVTRLHRAHLLVVLDLHWSAPATQRSVGQEPMADLDHAPAFWVSVARAFKLDPAVVFDLYNEPHGISWSCWLSGCRMQTGWYAAGMQQLVDAVRSTGARQPVIATGLQWGSDLRGWLAHRPRDPAHQLVAGLHVYDEHGCVSVSCWQRQYAPVARQVPVVTTELGQRECTGTFTSAYMSWADARGISYIGWAWNPAGCAFPALIRSWDGQPTPPGSRFRAHVRHLAAVAGGALIASSGY